MGWSHMHVCACALYMYKPEIVPILMSSTSTTVSNVIVGPRLAIPLPMLKWTSSCSKHVQHMQCKMYMYMSMSTLLYHCTTIPPHITPHAHARVHVQLYHPIV